MPHLDYAYIPIAEIKTGEDDGLQVLLPCDVLVCHITDQEVDEYHVRGVDECNILRRGKENLISPGKISLVSPFQIWGRIALFYLVSRVGLSSSFLLPETFSPFAKTSFVF